MKRQQIYQIYQDSGKRISNDAYVYKKKRTPKTTSITEQQLKKHQRSVNTRPHLFVTIFYQRHSSVERITGTERSRSSFFLPDNVRHTSYARRLSFSPVQQTTLKRISANCRFIGRARAARKNGDELFQPGRHRRPIVILCRY